MNQRKRDLHLAELVEQELAAKTVSALAQEDIQFALDHQNDSLEQLQQYLHEFHHDTCYGTESKGTD